MSVALTRHTGIGLFLNVIVHARPPYVTPCKALHSGTARMVSLQLLENVVTIFSRDDYSYSP